MESNRVYVYDSTKKDRLISFDTESITGYDNAGNPSSYRGSTLTWERGRLLAKYVKNGSTYNYTYDAQGLRQTKTVGQNTYKYEYDGSTLTREIRSATEYLYYLYGQNGIVGFIHKKSGVEKTYYYLKNLQGDITEIYDDNGTKCAEYRYDAWGTTTTTTNIDGIA